MISTSRFYIKYYDWVAVWGRYWLPLELGILITFKRSMFVVGCEVWKNGVMIFLGPFGVGFGKILEEDNDD